MASPSDIPGSSGPAQITLSEIAKSAPVISVTDHVFGALYDAIVSLGLPPGTKLSESDIARQFSVSRQPVRDAFFRLANLGLIRIRPQRSTLVTKISVDAVMQAAFIRTALERACVRAAAERAISVDLDSLADLVARQAAAMDDPLHFHRLDDAFHRKLSETAGHPGAWTVIRDHKAHMDRVRFLSLAFATPRTLEEHRIILAALQARDASRAEGAMDTHLGRIAQTIEDVRRSHAGYFDDATD